MRANGKVQSAAARKSGPSRKPAPSGLRRAAAKSGMEAGNGTANLREEVAAYRKDLILQAAVDAFFEFGYHDCTVDMIAERLGGTKAIVYYYFADKHAILQEIYRRALEEAQELIRKAMSGSDDPAVKLATIARYYAQWVVDNQRVVGVFWREERSLSAEARATVAVEQKRMDDLVATVIRDGVAKGVFDVPDVRTTARAIAGMITFTYTWWRSDHRLSREDTAEYYARMSQRLVGIHVA
jgi:AcrR family transcriptional regulator